MASRGRRYISVKLRDVHTEKHQQVGTNLKCATPLGLFVFYFCLFKNVLKGQ